MAYGNSYISPDKLEHNKWLFDHLIDMDKEIKELMKKDMEGGYQKGASVSDKVNNLFYMVCWLETQLIPYLCYVDSPKRIVDPKEKYKAKRDELISKFYIAERDSKVKEQFMAINEWAQILVIEAYNNGFMMKRVETESLPEETPEV